MDLFAVLNLWPPFASGVGVVLGPFCFHEGVGYVPSGSEGVGNNPGGSEGVGYVPGGSEGAGACQS